MDELYQDYIHSLGIVEPKLSDFHLTEEIIKKIEDKSLNSCPDGKAIVDDITTLKKTVESEYENKSLSDKLTHVKIRRYMQSSVVNKRMTIRNRKYIGDLCIYSIDHDGLTYWINKIHRHY